MERELSRKVDEMFKHGTLCPLYIVGFEESNSI